ncbi:hypothetical protein BDM02DRAFT_3108198 [Thelephora ganbajun]|uniref:Uncharacterized protein n=1 Tax=Thelephora ganbajun TaxID=370292 RepID=A0ACB6ZUU0_THEGA|nr:hypothetical protein BDM02DRAFT_3108198 [Thelephora ganbajun]
MGPGVTTTGVVWRGPVKPCSPFVLSDHLLEKFASYVSITHYQRGIAPGRFLHGRHISSHDKSIRNKDCVQRPKGKSHTSPRANVKKFQRKLSHSVEIITEFYPEYRDAKGVPPAFARRTLIRRIPIVRCICLALFHPLVRGCRGFHNSLPKSPTACHLFCLPIKDPEALGRRRYRMAHAGVQDVRRCRAVHI